LHHTATATIPPCLFVCFRRESNVCSGRWRSSRRSTRELEAAHAAWLGRLAEYDRAGDYTVDNYPSTAVAIRSMCRMIPGVAKGHVDLAHKLEDLPYLAEAFRNGDVSRAHVAVVAHAYTPERAEELNHLEPILVRIAEDHTPYDLAGVVQRVNDALDGDGGARAEDKQHRRRRAHLSKTFDGMGALDALFDPDDTDYLERALNAEMERDRAAGDARTTPQRRADAFMHLIRRGAIRAETATTRALSRHFVVAVDVEDFSTPERIEELRLEVRRHGHLCAATLERISCDAHISRVIMAGKSEVLDVGRATRTVTPALWNALVARDRHCQAPGCTRPPADCDAHHLTHWAHGGTTSLDNLKLYCWKHHREQHQHDPVHRRSRTRPRPPRPQTRRTTQSAHAPPIRR
jgi:hypothetical protein